MAAAMAGKESLGVTIGEVEVAAVEIVEEREQLRPFLVVILGARAEGVRILCLRMRD